MENLPGIQIGIVVQIHNDPENDFRVLVQVTSIDANGPAVWARMAHAYASNNAGIFFYPEVGDQVLLGFINNDLNHPVILGSMFRNAQELPLKSEIKPPFMPDAENTNKAIVTKNQLKITFDDVNMVTSITTPNSNHIILSDKDETIIINDQNSNSITLSAGGIVIKSCKDIKIIAPGEITLQADGDINANATANVSISGIEFSAKANTQATVQGSTAAVLSSSGEVSVKGAMVMIN